MAEDGCSYVEEVSKWMLMGVGMLAAQIPKEQYDEWSDDMAYRIAVLADKTHRYIHPSKEDSDAAPGDPQVLQHRTQ